MRYVLHLEAGASLRVPQTVTPDPEEEKPPSPKKNTKKQQDKEKERKERAKLHEGKLNKYTVVFDCRLPALPPQQQVCSRRLR